MQKYLIVSLFISFCTWSCKEKEVDKSYGKLSHDDVISLEQNSVYSYDQIVFEGDFAGDYFGEKIQLELAKNGKYIISYKGKEVKGEWFKKDDGSLVEFDSKKQLPFQFMKWSDPTTLMILNADGTADENGGNYLTRIEK